MKPIPPSIDATLIASERRSPFQLAEPEPWSEIRTRLQVDIDEHFIAEWDPFTGRAYRIVRVPAQPQEDSEK